MKELLEKEIQHDIVMAEEALYWIKPGKEILAGDKMFDVKRISRLGNGLVKVTGLFDEEETSLVKQFTEKQQQNNSKENRKIAQLIQVMQAIFDHAASKDFTSIPIASMHYQFNDNSIFPAITTILTPPPRS